MSFRLPLLFCLLTAGCSTPAAPRADPDVLPSGEAARKQYWQTKAAEIRPDWDRERLEAYLEGVRVRTRQPFRGYSGTFRRGNEPERDYTRYVLDEDFNLFVVREPNGGRFLSAEVTGFWDLRDRVDPALFPALRHLHRAPIVADLWDYDPVLLIRAVNAVRSLGEKAGAALAAYDELSSRLRPPESQKYGLQTDRLLPVAWLVFEKPPFGPRQYGLEPRPMAIPDPALWPLFPFTAEEGVPFVLGEVVASSIDPAKYAAGTLRPGLLAPAVDPAEAVERLVSSRAWQILLTTTDALHPLMTRKEATQLTHLVREQALRAVAPFYTPPPDEDPQDCCKDPQDVRWARIREEVRALRLRWDPDRQDFVRSR